MIPILYEATEREFKTYGLGEVPFTQWEVTRERNGEYTFYGQIPMDEPMAKELINGRWLKADAGYRTKFQSFEIVRVRKNDNGLFDVYANHISYQLAYATLIPNFKVEKLDALSALKLYEAELVSDFNFTTWSDIDTKNSTNISIDRYENPRKLLGGVSGSILDVWGGEYEFDNLMIRLHKQLGRKAPTTIEYGRNLTSAEVDADINSTYTSVRPYAVVYIQEEEKTEEKLFILQEPYIDSEHYRDTMTRKILAVDVSSKLKENEQPTNERLRELGLAYMKDNQVGIPKTNIKLSYVDLASTLDYSQKKIVEEVELCDILPVYYSKLGITDENAKIVKIVWDGVREVNKLVEVGVIGKSYSRTVLEKMQQQIDDNQTKVTNTIERVISTVSADGRTVNYYGTLPENTEFNVGDTHFYKNGIYNVMAVWDGTRWVVVIDEETFQKNLDDQLTEVFNQFSTERTETEQAINEALDSAKAEAERLDEERQQVIDSQIANVISKADTDKLELSNAIDTALTDAIAEAERLDEERQQVIEGKFEEVNQAQSTLEQSIATAEQNAQDALAKAGASEDLAKTAKQASDNALSQFQTTSQQLADAKSTAEQTLKNALNALSGANSVITQSQTLLDNAKSAKTEASQLLTTAQQQLAESGVISGDITTFKDEVNNAIKGYVTQSTYNSDNQTLNTRLNEWEKTANGIRTSISEVNGKVDNLQIGGRNIIRGTSEAKSSRLTSTVWDDLTVPLEVGEYSFQFIAKASENIGVNVYFNDDTGQGRIKIASQIYTYLTTAYQKFTGTINVTRADGSNDNRIVFRIYSNSSATIEIKEGSLKVEKGNIATDWSPAPEDLVSQSEYSVYKNKTEETVKGFTRTVSAYEQDVTGYKNQVAVFNQTVDGYSAQLAINTNTTQGYTTEVASYKQAVNGYSSELSKNTTATNGYKTEVAGYKQTVQGYGSKLTEYTQSNNALTAKVNEYEATVDGYTQSLTRVEGKVDNLQVGGRNLILNSYSQKVPYSDHGNINVNTFEEGVHIITPINNGNVYGLVTPSIELVKGHEYTLSFDVLTNTAIGVHWYAITGGGAYSGGSIPNTKGEWIKHKFTYVQTRDSFKDRFLFGFHGLIAGSQVKYKNLKLEKGNIATDWTPAPEDLVSQSEYTVYQNQVKSTTDEHTRRLTALDGDGGRVSKVEQTATQIQRSLSDYARTTYVDTKITEKAGEITTNLTKLEGKFDDLQIGGRNLIRALNSNNYNGIWEVKEEGVVIRGAAGAGNTLKALYKAKTSSGDHVFSYAMKEGSSHRALIHIYDENEKEIENKSISGWAWNAYYKGYHKQVSNNGYAVFNAPSETRYITGVIVPPWQDNPIVNSTLLWMKLEKGNKPTAWTPAPEDMITQTEFQTVKESTSLYERTLGSTETLIKSNIAKITMTDSSFQKEVSKNTDLTNTKSQVTQLSNSWALTLKSGNDIKTAINATTDGIRLKGNLITLDGQVNMTSGFIVPEGNIGNLSAGKITSGTINSARIDAKTIVTNGLQANVVKSEHILADSAFFDKIFTGTTMTDRLIAKGAWITNANISSLDAAKITSGQIDSSRINVSEVRSKILTTNMVKSDHILANEALFTKLFTNDLATTKLATKTAWIKSGMIGEAQIGTAHISQIDASKANIINISANSITSGTMTANRISGGTLTSTNGSTNFDLNTGQLSFLQQGVAIKNQFSGRPLQYLGFYSGTIHGVQGSYTALMSNSGNIIAMDTNSAGIQIWNSFDKKTAVNLYGNNITFMRHAKDTNSIDIDTINRAITNVNTINELRIVPMAMGSNKGVAIMYGDSAGMWIGGYGDFAFKHGANWIGKANIIN